MFSTRGESGGGRDSRQGSPIDFSVAAELAGPTYRNPYQWADSTKKGRAEQLYKSMEAEVHNEEQREQIAFEIVQLIFEDGMERAALMVGQATPQGLHAEVSRRFTVGLETYEENEIIGPDFPEQLDGRFESAKAMLPNEVRDFILEKQLLIRKGKADADTMLLIELGKKHKDNANKFLAVSEK